jgi:polyhydroxyalkanoate synthesis regulator phasin
MKKSEENQDMDKMVKMGMEFGVGVAYMAVKALNGALDKLEKEGRINRKDSERLVKETVKKYQAQGDVYARTVKTKMDSLTKSAPFVTKKEMKELNARIDSISKMLNKRKK